MSKKPNGYVIYRGPSMLDGKPIVVIATGFAEKSENVKTGAMIQTWILREDLNPVDAIHIGSDSSICGTCPHRGEVIEDASMEFGFKNVNRRCYVTVYQAPRSVWASYRRGIYPEIPLNYLSNGMFWNKTIRIGSYGDPAAVPVIYWKKILHKSKSNTGYTHMWRIAPLEFRNFVMASVDTIDEHFEATALGYRTFRVRNEGEPLLNREIACPASFEMGHKTTCASCKGCGGLGSKARVSFAIMDHGNRARLKRAAENRKKVNS